MASERDSREASSGEPNLVEHSSTGSRFTRLFGNTFSLEDGFTLKHVAAVLVALAAVLVIFGLVSMMGGFATE